MFRPYLILWSTFGALKNSNTRTAKAAITPITTRIICQTEKYLSIIEKALSINLKSDAVSGVTLVATSTPLVTPSIIHITEITLIQKIRFLNKSVKDNVIITINALHMNTYGEPIRK